ncbi:PucR family transcriptional regulator [Streptomyces cyaneofuscatus]|uniref:PucR family transcriptional regulator n=1 Tax=Streptomyces cyaneofuscatus TaxID=66883 RepID=UPI0036C6E87A
MTAHRGDSPSEWIFRLAPDPAAPAAPSPASSAQGIAEATARLGPAPVAWGVTVGHELADAITREVPELGGTPASFETLRMGTEAATLHTLLLLIDPDPAAEPRIPEESLLGDREFARRRLGLDKVLRGIRVAQGVLARALMAACQELAAPAEQVREFRRVVDLLFAFMDAFSSRMTAEYSAEHDRWLTSGAAAREETVRAVLDGQPLREEAASELLAYRLEGRHLAVVAWCESPTADTTGDLQRAAGELLRLRGCAATLVVPVGRTTVWAWGDVHAAPSDRTTSDHATSDRTGSGLTASGRTSSGRTSSDRTSGTFPYADGVRFAFGAVRTGVAGFRRSHEDAQHVVRVMELNPLGTAPAVDHAEVELAALLSADLPSLRRFVHDELGALAADTRQADQLRQTLRLYLRNERGLTATAQRLHVARNTVTYRVKRAQELLGHDVTGRLPEVMAALEATRTLGPAVLLTPPPSPGPVRSAG